MNGWWSGRQRGAIFFGAIAAAMMWTAVASAVPPIDPGVYRGGPEFGLDTPEPGSTSVWFVVRDGAVVEGLWSWPATCVQSPGGMTRETQIGFAVDSGSEEDSTADSGPLPIDSNGHFRGEFTESGFSQTEPPPAPGHPWSMTTIVEGTIDGSQATGTAVFRSEAEQQFQPGGPTYTDRCEGSADWTAAHVPTPPVPERPVKCRSSNEMCVVSLACRPPDDCFPESVEVLVPKEVGGIMGRAAAASPSAKKMIVLAKTGAVEIPVGESEKLNLETTRKGRKLMKLATTGDNRVDTVPGRIQFGDEDPEKILIELS